MHGCYKYAAYYCGITSQEKIDIFNANILAMECRKRNQLKIKYNFSHITHGAYLVEFVYDMFEGNEEFYEKITAVRKHYTTVTYGDG